MILKIGSTGKEVEKLQRRLSIDVDGDFGLQTEKAVKAWQEANSLTVDGIIGLKSWRKLFPISDLELDIALLEGEIPGKVFNELPDVIERFNINTPLRMAHFLSQCDHESLNFTDVEENLNYSSARLQQVFKKYFPTKALADQYQNKPSKIASRVYANRLGNGNETTGDGYKFRGRGYIQCTGKTNYTLFSEYVDENLVEQPDLLIIKYPLTSAAWFFTKNKINQISDTGATETTVRRVTRAVNGGYNGLEDRLREFKKYYDILT